MTRSSSRFPLRGAPGLGSPGHSRSAAVQTAAPRVSVRGRVTLIPGKELGCRGDLRLLLGENPAGAVHVGLHLDQQVVDGVETDLAAPQPGDEVDRDPRAVQLEV